MLKTGFTRDLLEAGCDEAGRGCLAGPVYAAAVILPHNYQHPMLNDSKKLSVNQRNLLRDEIEHHALAWAVASLDHEAIDRENILWASVHAMHLALSNLNMKPQLVLVDGNRFRPYLDIPFQCIVKGDATFSSIAAASILAKTHRDEYMIQLHDQHPEYEWIKNKGYPTASHIRAVQKLGISPYHRKTFRISGQVKLSFDE
ncbi:MAG: ribonuclease HII [Bacteroidetes bacterium]|nr:ribonuclease HII [Bacteroidota bacterium]